LSRCRFLLLGFGPSPSPSSLFEHILIPPKLFLIQYISYGNVVVLGPSEVTLSNFVFSVHSFSSSLNYSRRCGTSLFVVRTPSLAHFQVREARVHVLIHPLHAFVKMLLWKCIECCWEWVPGWKHAEQWERTDILAQASSSCLGKNSRNSLSFLLERSPRRGAIFFSDELSRSGETASPKRELANFSKAIVVVSPKRESAAWARPSLGFCYASFHEYCWLFDWLVHLFIV